MTDLDQRAKLLDDNVRLSKEIERLEAELNRVTDRLLQRDRMVAELEQLQALVSWLKPNDYGTGFYCAEDICEAIIDAMEDVEKFQDIALGGRDDTG